ncbi:hypothetical protein Poli38472_008769 [Pythium oligandrum]|uniref:Transmembrane protein n=1 Tax=Pythium oligandrum TaxID=41045 RepID=A0A8K1C415_PYTOL|nr:hypothetical protein Poli38472_008769 [Pythium oligandrum]|eukprot:TMW56121.1 hypothetical protein Poli38472_008769 [Pythium oligandrum]
MLPTYAKTDLEMSSFWISTLLYLCIVNTTIAAFAVAYVIASSDSNAYEAPIEATKTTTAVATQLTVSPAANACGKRKRCEPEFSTEREWKQRRIVRRVQIRDRLPRRSNSLDDAEDIPAPVALRRVVSCEEISAIYRTHLAETDSVITKSSSMEKEPSSLLDLIGSRLRVAVKQAVDDMLASLISFATYGVLLFLLREYCAVAVGVSLDLGAFSVEL